MQPSSVLIIDDEVQVRRLLRRAMEAQGWKVYEAASGSHGLNEAALVRPDMVLLDLGLPDMDGTAVLKRLREWSEVPVIILSVRESPEIKIAALDAGADDYLQKPFDTRELLARLRAVDRRRQQGTPPAVSIILGELTVDLAHHEIQVEGRSVKVTPTEFSLLAILAKHHGKIVTQKQILREVWGPQAEAQSQYLRVHLTHLRRKLTEAGLQSAKIVNESGVGYRLTDTTA